LTEDQKLILSTCAQVQKELAQQTQKDSEFSKNIFSAKSDGSSGLYDDKPLKANEEEEEEEEEVDPELIERQEEAEYLATLSNFHWFVYPFFKSVELCCDKIFGCKSRAKQQNEERRAEIMKR
jgi:hypothetical protein